MANLVVNHIVVVGERFETSADEDITTYEKLMICFQCFTKTLKTISMTVLILILISNPISFLIVAIIHWKCDFKSNIPQLMIVWSLIHFVIYLKLIYLKFKNKFNANYFVSKVQVLLNFCLIVWFIVFMLLVVILSNGTPDDFSTTLITYILFNMFISFVLFGIPCILFISPAICDTR